MVTYGAVCGPERGHVLQPSASHHGALLLSSNSALEVLSRASHRSKQQHGLAVDSTVTIVLRDS